MAARDIDAWAAGFFDGDGTIRMQSALDVRVAQCGPVNAIPNALTRLQNEYGGWIRVARDQINRQRTLYEWILTDANDVFNFIERVLVFSIIKSPQLVAAMEFLIERDSFPPHSRQRAPLRKELDEELRRLKQNYHLVNVPTPSSINFQWLAGFFDAEGCVTISNERKRSPGDASIAVYFAQKNCPRLLEVIAVGCNGRVRKDQTVVCFNGQRAENILRRIRDYTTVKQEQIDAALQLRAITCSRKRGCPYTAASVQRIQQLRSRLKILKHVT